jgi:hypothetical protein
MTLWKESKELDENHMQERFKEQLRNYQNEDEEIEPLVLREECTIV